MVDASRGAASVAATVKGFQALRPDSGIAGVLVNRANGEGHYALIREAVAYHTGLPCVGYLAKNQKLAFPSRHLGLVPARETPDLLPRLEEAAAEAENTLDLPRILSLAEQAPSLPGVPGPALPDFSGYRLGVALDEAFHFYYRDNLDALRASGMALIFFSLLKDEGLPGGLDGLYIGGGYPEVFAQGLAANRSMRESVRAALEGGLRCYAECGGLMYLSREIDGQPMAGFLPVICHMTDRLQRFGYVTVEDSAGLSFPAHEFHHAVARPVGEADCAYTVRKVSRPDQAWRCGYVRGRTLAAFAHVYFGDRPQLIRRFFA